MQKIFLSVDVMGVGNKVFSFQYQTHIDRFGEDGSLDDNVEPFLSKKKTSPHESLFSGIKCSLP